MLGFKVFYSVFIQIGAKNFINKIKIKADFSNSMDVIVYWVLGHAKPFMQHKKFLIQA